MVKSTNNKPTNSVTNGSWKAINWATLLSGILLLGAGGLLVLAGQSQNDVSWLLFLLSLLFLIPGAILVLIVILSAVLRVVFSLGSGNSVGSAGNGGNVTETTNQGLKSAPKTLRIVRVILAIIIIPMIVIGLVIVMSFLNIIDSLS